MKVMRTFSTQSFFLLQVISFKLAWRVESNIEYALRCNAVKSRSSLSLTAPWFPPEGARKEEKIDFSCPLITRIWPEITENTFKPSSSLRGQRLPAIRTHAVMRLAPDWHPATLQTALILGSVQAVTYIMKCTSRISTLSSASFIMYDLWPLFCWGVKTLCCWKFQHLQKSRN